METGNGDAGSEKVSRKKLVVVGDGACGKTCLLVAYTKNEFSETHVPTVFETHVVDIKVQDERLQMALWDTAGQEDYELLRPLSYPSTDVLLLCFAVDSRDSYENVRLKWVPEVLHHCPKTPLLLVGTKTDLRAGGGGGRAGATVVSGADAAKLAKSIDAVAYVECSAKTREGIEEVFRTAALVALGRTKPRRRRGEVWCVLL